VLTGARAPALAAAPGHVTGVTLPVDAGFTNKK
jgi:hypothetical protein